MAIADLKLIIETNILRRNQLQLDIASFQDQKSLAVYAQGDAQSILSSEKASIRSHFKDLYENDPELQAKYTDYTEIAEYEEEIDKITAQMQDELERLAAWETQLDAQIATASVELEEIKAYLDSLKSMYGANINEDFDFGLGG
ncbi:hypothetical protein IKB17_04675 [bacterium]|nr:hypothetical protein [bacterium]